MVNRLVITMTTEVKQTFVIDDFNVSHGYFVSIFQPEHKSTLKMDLYFKIFYSVYIKRLDVHSQSFRVY